MEYEQIVDMKHVKVSFKDGEPQTGRIGVAADNSVWVLYDDPTFPNLELLYYGNGTPASNGMTVEPID
ncbi:hypothetical protein [Bifidobacterium felsineum]|uniref:hypothetical protein n=1 Tax=Bifidobacterium felsineum TaxID=2045440 RepID=UPI001BDC2D2D|nr:hypothetical protein [Bifidobacterium felsineum]MBT1164605.1 hypothetical protein [Bifidobacterium felsineum]